MLLCFFGAHIPWYDTLYKQRRCSRCEKNLERKPEQLSLPLVWAPHECYYINTPDDGFYGHCIVCGETYDPVNDR